MNYTPEIKKLVVIRLEALPPEVSFSIGSFGNFTRDELIEEVQKETSIGNATIEMQLTFIKKLPKLTEELMEK